MTDHTFAIEAMAFSSNGKTLITTSQADRCIFVWSLREVEREIEGVERGRGARREGAGGGMEEAAALFSTNQDF